MFGSSSAVAAGPRLQRDEATGAERAKVLAALARFLLETDTDDSELSESHTHAQRRAAEMLSSSILRKYHGSLFEMQRHGHSAMLFYQDPRTGSVMVIDGVKLVG